MNIEEATHQNCDEIFDLLAACKEKLIANRIFQWDDQYPSMADVKNDIANGALLKYVFNKKIAGVICFDKHQEPEYQTVKWAFKDHPIAVIHRLAVHPNVQGQGIASDLLKVTESMIAQEGFHSIRLDAYSGNLQLLAFYQNRGYQEAGEICFPWRDLPFVCFEKELDTDWVCMEH